MFFKLYKWYQITQSITCIYQKSNQIYKTESKYSKISKKNSPNSLNTMLNQLKTSKKLRKNYRIVKTPVSQKFQGNRKNFSKIWKFSCYFRMSLKKTGTIVKRSLRACRSQSVKNCINSFDSSSFNSFFPFALLALPHFFHSHFMLVISSYLHLTVI